MSVFTEILGFLFGSRWWIIWHVALAALVTMLSSMAMLQLLGSAPRVAVTFAWASSAAFFPGNLVMARLAATRAPDSISVGPNWVIGLVCAAIVLLGLLVFGVIPFDPTSPKPSSSNLRES